MGLCGIHVLARLPRSGNSLRLHRRLGHSRLLRMPIRAHGNEIRATKGQRVSVAQAAGTVGGIVLRYPPEPGTMGHIAICDGHGGTVEAKGTAFGVVADTVQGRRWDTGVLIPGVSYGGAAVVPINHPARLYHIGAPNMDRDVIRAIQTALAARGFDPGPIDGRFGENTAAAVGAFQSAHGLVMDGEVGPQTAAALGVTI